MSNAVNAEHLTELEELHAKTTPGEWVWGSEELSLEERRKRISGWLNPGGTHLSAVWVAGDEVITASTGDGGASSANASFIATAHKAVPDLIARIRELEADNAKKRDALQFIGDIVRHQCEMLTEVTHSQDLLFDDKGDGDYDSMWGRAADNYTAAQKVPALESRIEQLEAALPDGGAAIISQLTYKNLAMTQRIEELEARNYNAAAFLELTINNVEHLELQWSNAEVLDLAKTALTALTGGKPEDTKPCLDCATPSSGELCESCTEVANKIGSAEQRIRQLRAEGSPQ